jgi:hypothetical protein
MWGKDLVTKVEVCFYTYMIWKYLMIALLVMVKIHTHFLHSVMVPTILAQIFGICVTNLVISLAHFLVWSCNWVKLWMLGLKICWIHGYLWCVLTCLKSNLMETTLMCKFIEAQFYGSPVEDWVILLMQWLRSVSMTLQIEVQFMAQVEGWTKIEQSHWL